MNRLRVVTNVLNEADINKSWANPKKLVCGHHHLFILGTDLKNCLCTNTTTKFSEVLREAKTFVGSKNVKYDSLSLFHLCLNLE